MTINTTQKLAKEKLRIKEFSSSVALKEKIPRHTGTKKFSAVPPRFPAQAGLLAARYRALPLPARNTFSPAMLSTSGCLRTLRAGEFGFKCSEGTLPGSHRVIPTRYQIA